MYSQALSIKIEAACGLLLQQLRQGRVP